MTFKIEDAATALFAHKTKREYKPLSAVAKAFFALKDLSGMTNAELAKILNCTPATIVNMHIGKTDMKLGYLEILAAHLGIEVEIVIKAKTSQ